MSEREQAVQLTILTYVGEPCRICGQEITVADLEIAVLVDVSGDKKSRAAHGICWRNLCDVVQKIYAAGQLAILLRF